MRIAHLKAFRTLKIGSTGIGEFDNPNDSEADCVVNFQADIDQA